MPLQMENMIRQSLNIFQPFPNKLTCRDPAVHLTMCNWGLSKEIDPVTVEIMLTKIAEEGYSIYAIRCHSHLSQRCLFWGGVGEGG